MRWVQRDLGIWELCYIRWLWVRGTTPRNAGIWSLDVSLGVKIERPAVWLTTGRHWGATIWLDGDRCLHLHRRPPTAGRRRCVCWGCTGANTALPTTRGGWDVAYDHGPLPVSDDGDEEGEDR